MSARFDELEAARAAKAVARAAREETGDPDAEEEAGAGSDGSDGGLAVAGKKVHCPPLLEKIAAREVAYLRGDEVAGRALTEEETDEGLVRAAEAVRGQPRKAPCKAASSAEPPLPAPATPPMAPAEGEAEADPPSPEPPMAPAEGEAEAEPPSPERAMRLLGAYVPAARAVEAPPAAASASTPTSGAGRTGRRPCRPEERTSGTRRTAPRTARVCAQTPLPKPPAWLGSQPLRGPGHWLSVRPEVLAAQAERSLDVPMLFALIEFFKQSQTHLRWCP